MNYDLDKVIDTFQKALESNVWDDFQKVIGDITKVGRAIKVIQSVRERHFLNKIKSFAEKANELGFSAKAYQNLETKYGGDKVLEELIIAIDRFDRVEKSYIFAYLMQSLEMGHITWLQFKELTFMLEQAAPSVYEESSYYLVNPDTGHIGLSGSIDIVHATGASFGNNLTNEGKLLIRYGILPYQDREKELKDGF